MDFIRSEVGRKNEKDMYHIRLEQDWNTAVEMYEKNVWYFSRLRMSKSGDTALHLAAAHGAEGIVAKLVDVIKSKMGNEGYLKTLSAKNKRWETPLHHAASRGSLAMCKSILSGRDFYRLVHIRNYRGETPLFLAALHGQKETFLYLHDGSINCPERPSTTPWRRNNGDTILYCALRREYFDLSFQIIHLYKDQFIATAVNEKGITPLHVLASKPSAFKSGIHLGWWNKILYRCIIVEPLQAAVPVRPTDETDGFQSVEIVTSENDKTKTPVDDRTCHTIFASLSNMVLRFMKRAELLVINSARGQNTNFPPNYATCLDFLKYVSGLRGFGLLLLNTTKIKEKHEWCSQVVDKLVQECSSLEQSYMDDGKDPGEGTSDRKEIVSVMDDKLKNTVSSSHDVKEGKEDEKNQQGHGIRNATIHDDMLRNFTYALALWQASKEDDQNVEKMTALLTAAKNGVGKMMKIILNNFPMAIHETSSQDKNILLVAVEHRQPQIVQILRNMVEHDIWDSLRKSVDNEGNNALHLAAKYTAKTWHISGSAMQMQSEIKWYEYVKGIVPENIIVQKNNKEKTPVEIFEESHKDLVKEGGKWLKSTSESCSVVAALIAGVSFATSSSVPGGIDDKTGRANLEGEPAFNVFAISSLAALCFSVTALIMFLAILTSRQQPRDYLRDLPFKLLLGLSFLLVSIVLMLVSFCAAYFFVLKDRMHNVVFVIYAAICLSVSFYALAQFPLYWDLLKAILAEVPQPAHKGG